MLTVVANSIVRRPSVQPCKVCQAAVHEFCRTSRDGFSVTHGLLLGVHKSRDTGKIVSSTKLITCSLNPGLFTRAGVRGQYLNILSRDRETWLSDPQKPYPFKKKIVLPAQCDNPTSTTLDYDTLNCHNRSDLPKSVN